MSYNHGLSYRLMRLRTVKNKTIRALAFTAIITSLIMTVNFTSTIAQAVDGTMEWENRLDNHSLVENPLLGSAAFRITPNPFTGIDFLDITDNDLNDKDLDDGQFRVEGVLFDEYSIEQITPGPGTILDDEFWRIVTASEAEPNQVVGTQDVDDHLGHFSGKDFFNVFPGLFIRGSPTNNNTTHTHNNG